MPDRSHHVGLLSWTVCQAQLQAHSWSLQMQIPDDKLLVWMTGERLQDEPQS